MFTKPILTFCGLTFALSWGVFFICLPLGVFETPAGFSAGAFAFMWGPAVSAVICAYLFDRQRMMEALSLNPVMNRWMLVAWLAPIVICIGAVLISWAAPGASPQSLGVGLTAALPAGASNVPPEMIPIMILSGFTIGAAINGVLLISEELGWRGYLWDQLIGIGFWKTALFTGIVWGFWHAPLIALGHNYPGYPVRGIFAMVVFTTLLCPIIGYIREKNGSVWSASLFHGTINAIAGFTLMAVATQGQIWRGLVGAGGMIALLLGCIIVWRIRNASKTA